MNLATQYAKALHLAGGNTKHLKNLKDALKRHGHEKLLPNVYEEYKKLLTAQERLAMHKRSTPGKERTRILIELYQKLVATR